MHDQCQTRFVKCMQQLLHYFADTYFLYCPEKFGLSNSEKSAIIHNLASDWTVHTHALSAFVAPGTRYPENVLNLLRNVLFTTASSSRNSYNNGVASVVLYRTSLCLSVYHSLKLTKHRCHLEIRRHFYSERVVNRCNSLDFCPNLLCLSLS